MEISKFYQQAILEISIPYSTTAIGAPDDTTVDTILAPNPVNVDVPFHDCVCCLWQKHSPAMLFSLVFCHGQLSSPKYRHSPH